MANSTPDTPEVSETKLAALKMDELHKPELLAKVKDHHAAASRPSATELSQMKLGELREHAHKLGIDGADELHKPELLAKVKDHHAADSGRREASSAKKNRGGNSTPDTPDVSETKLAALKMDELRTHAHKHGIDGADELHKPELLAKVKDHHYAQAHGGKHRPDTGSGSPGRAGAPSTADEDRGGFSTPDTPETNTTASSVASTDKPQDRPHPPGIHSSDVYETDEPARPQLRATVAGAPTTTQDEHLSPLEQERPGLDHTVATAPRATETTGTTPGRLDVDTQTRESGPARLPEQVPGRHQQVSAPVSIEEVDVDREPTTESIREVADDDQAIFGKQPAEVRPAVVLPEELSVVDPRAVLEDRDVPETKIHTAPAGIGGEIRHRRSEVDVDVPNIHGG